MGDGPGFGEGEKLTFVLRLGTVDREVAVVHLVDYQVLIGTAHRLVALPPLRVGFLQVDDDTLLSVHGDGLGKDAGRCLTVDHKLIGLTLQVAGHHGLVDAAHIIDGGFPRHGHRVAVDHHADTTMDARAMGRIGGKEFKHRLLRRIGHLVKHEGSILRRVAGHHECNSSCHHQFIQFIIHHHEATPFNS